jgi:squalene synthase HpnC
MGKTTQYDFATHLRQWGPTGVACANLRESRAYCDQFARGHEENFPVLSFALPRSLRPHFTAIYSYCRWADDLGDEVASPVQALQLLDWWEEKLDELYAGRPTHPVMVALQPTIEQFRISADPFRDLLSAFRQDQTVTRYEDQDQLLDYCRRSANPVGRLVLYLFSSDPQDCFGNADAICTGLQLANFWQDVSVDYAEKGRIYIPGDIMRAHGVSESDIARQVHTPATTAMISELVDDADAWLVRGLPLARQLSGRFSIMTAMFAEGGRAILRRIRRQRYNVLQSRPRLGRWDKLQLASRAIAYWARLA